MVCQEFAGPVTVFRDEWEGTGEGLTYWKSGSMFAVGSAFLWASVKVKGGWLPRLVFQAEVAMENTRCCELRVASCDGQRLVGVPLAPGIVPSSARRQSGLVPIVRYHSSIFFPLSCQASHSVVCHGAQCIGYIHNRHEESLTARASTVTLRLTQA